MPALYALTPLDRKHQNPEVILLQPLRAISRGEPRLSASGNYKRCDGAKGQRCSTGRWRSSMPRGRGASGWICVRCDKLTVFVHSVAARTDTERCPKMKA